MDMDLEQLALASAAGNEAIESLMSRLNDANDEVDRAEEQAKIARARRDEIERVALEFVTASGKRSLPAAGRSWYVQIEPRVSVRAEARERVLVIADALGIRDLVETVNTAGLKAWLREQAKENGMKPNAEGRDDIVTGTPFDGLVSCYMEPTLRSRRL
jgi:hypothetical protein